MERIIAVLFDNEKKPTRAKPLLKVQQDGDTVIYGEPRAAAQRLAHA